MKKVAIIGAGASGVCLADLLGRYVQKHPVFELDLYEASEQPMRKLRATGNGRCNFTNSRMDASHYTGKAAQFVEEGLKFGYEEALDYFSRLGIEAQVMESGQVYPQTLMAETLVEKLADALTYEPVHLHTGYQLKEVERRDQAFSLLFQAGESEVVRTCDYLVLATGGAYGIRKKEWSNGYNLAKQLGHPITRLHSGIVSLKVRESYWTRQLQGLKVRAGLTFQDHEIVDDLLFTDYGLSGLAVFRQSNRILDFLQEEGESAVPVSLNFFPERTPKELFTRLEALRQEEGNWTLSDALNGLLPRALNDQLLILTGSDPKSRFSSWTDKQARDFLDTATCFPLMVTGSRKKDHGQVTCGGVATEAVDPRSLESRLQPGLYFTGEILDVQGECGGYNLHWAWASAHAVYQQLIMDSGR